MRRWIVWLSAITLAEVLVFHHYNAQLSVNQVPVKKAVAAVAKPNPDFKKIMNIGPHELQPKLYGLSPDGSKFAYVNADNDFYVVNPQTGQVITHDQLNYKADYIHWFDSNHLFIGTENPATGNLKNIRFSTYDVTTNSFHLWQVYKGYLQSARLENVTFSPFTNDTYVLLGDPKHSIEYHFDTNNNMWSYHLSGRLIRNWMVSQTTDQLYYQDLANGVPYIWVYDYRTTSSHLVARNAKLLSMDSNTLFYAVLNSGGDVTAIRKITNWQKGSTQVFTLTSPVAFANIYAKGKTFYQVGSTSMTNLQTQKSIDLPNNQQTIITNNNLYVMGQKGNVYYYSPSTTTTGHAPSETNNTTNSVQGTSNSSGQ